MAKVGHSYCNCINILQKAWDIAGHLKATLLFNRICLANNAVSLQWDSKHQAGCVNLQSSE